ncbi:helix-turn-helix transcriptional regulator [Haloechinothrix sp. YIM 98757]|uniref:Helix-turn-helix transcriptional regulator n=1 Tax=Haloechinothrix aidingensis TaxID=2752311 RepID=A0A838AER7_9PSEU|nr:helix-turn-helix transcriptional regulator [Haloechinothrix aidingensis]MBA0127799.1 helix-turn-helix transcriptional regulator [Haloechinothrix aidingensis]
MSGYTRWKDVRTSHVERAGGAEAVVAGKDELLATVRGHRLTEIRRARGLTRQDVADRMGITKARGSRIEQARISGHEVLARCVIIAPACTAEAEVAVHLAVTLVQWFVQDAVHSRSST